LFTANQTFLRVDYLRLDWPQVGL